MKRTKSLRIIVIYFVCMNWVSLAVPDIQFLAPSSQIKLTTSFKTEEQIAPTRPFIESDTTIRVHEDFLDSSLVQALGFGSTEDFKKLLKLAFGGIFDGEVIVGIQKKPSKTSFYTQAYKPGQSVILLNQQFLDLAQSRAISSPETFRHLVTMAVLDHSRRIQNMSDKLILDDTEHRLANALFLKGVQVQNINWEWLPVTDHLPTRPVTESWQDTLSTSDYGRTLSMILKERSVNKQGIDENEVFELIERDLKEIKQSGGDVPKRLPPLLKGISWIINDPHINVSNKTRFLIKLMELTEKHSDQSDNPLEWASDYEFWYVGHMFVTLVVDNSDIANLIESILTHFYREENMKVFMGILDGIKVTPDLVEKLTPYLVDKLKVIVTLIDDDESLKNHFKNPFIEAALLDLDSTDLKTFLPYLTQNATVQLAKELHSQGNSFGKELLGIVASKGVHNIHKLNKQALKLLLNDQVFGLPADRLVYAWTFLGELVKESQTKGSDFFIMALTSQVTQFLEDLTAENLILYVVNNISATKAMFNQLSGEQTQDASPNLSNWQEVFADDIMAMGPVFFENANQSLQNGLPGKEFLQWEAMLKTLPEYLRHNIDSAIPVSEKLLPSKIFSHKSHVDTLMEMVGNMMAASKEYQPSMEDLWSVQSKLNELRMIIQEYESSSLESREEGHQRAMEQIVEVRDNYVKFFHGNNPYLMSLFILGTQKLMLDFRLVEMFRSELPDIEPRRSYNQKELEKLTETNPLLNDLFQTLFGGEIPTGFGLDYGSGAITLSMDTRSFVKYRSREIGLEGSLSQLGEVVFGGSYLNSLNVQGSDWATGLFIVSVFGSDQEESRQIVDHETRHLQTERFFMKIWNTSYYSFNKIEFSKILSEAESDSKKAELLYQYASQVAFEKGHNEMVSYTAEGNSHYRHLLSLKDYWSGYQKYLEIILSEYGGIKSIKGKVLNKVRNKYFEVHQRYGREYLKTLPVVMEQLEKDPRFMGLDKKALRREAAEQIASFVRLVPFEKTPALLRFLKGRVKKGSRKWVELISEISDNLARKETTSSV